MVRNAKQADLCQLLTAPFLSLRMQFHGRELKQSSERLQRISVDFLVSGQGVVRGGVPVLSLP